VIRYIAKAGAPAAGIALTVAGAGTCGFVFDRSKEAARPGEILR
jgi:hypothetical protein